jgi:hypothetical protein
MSKKTTIKKPASKVNKKADMLVKIETVPTVEVTGEPVATVQPVEEVKLRSEHFVEKPREKRNGVTRPRPGKCGDVWEVCDEMLAAGKEVSFEVIRAELPASIADATIKTQRQRHRTFHGVGRNTA